MHRVGSHENVKGKAIGITAARPMPRHYSLVNSAAADKWAQSTECLQNGYQDCIDWLMRAGLEA